MSENPNTSELAEILKAAATAASESQRLAATALNDAQSKLAEITATATQALATMTQISDNQAIIAAKSDHIQKAQEHADTVRANLDRSLTSAKQLVTEVEAQKSRTQSAADSISTVLTETRTIKTSVESDITTIGAAVAAASESQKLATIALAEAQSKLAEIANTATQAIAAMTQIADHQAVVATKSDHIQKAQEHADKVRANLDRALTAANQQLTEAEGLKSRAQSAADSANTLLTEIRTTKSSAETDVAEVSAALKIAEESALSTKSLADKSIEVESRIAAYEKRLAELDAQCVTQLKEITGLLPGATTAGLAHSFDERRKTFLKPHGRWQIIFVGSVVIIVLLAATGLWQALRADKVPTYDELVRLWLARLPVAGALLWLALHASRESALAKRLEEDYGYKSAIAACFLGFQKQMSEIGAVPESPLAKLCGNTLATIANPPGRIYDNHELTVSPVDEVKEVTKAATEVVNAIKPTAKS